MSRVRSGETELTMVSSHVERTTGEEGRDISEDDFFRTVQTEGVLIDGSYYATTGTGKSTRYHEYDSQTVSGLVYPDDVDEDSAKAAGITEVKNHEESLVADVKKTDLGDVYDKYVDGFGHAGIAFQEEAAEEAAEEDDEPEPMDDDELVENIQELYGATGFFAEDEDGEQKVVSLATREGRLMGYITGSHVGSTPTSLESVDDYRHAVFQSLTGDAATEEDQLADLEGPDEVPIATDGMMEKFKESGQSVQDDEELKEKLSEDVKRRWEDGQYDHLRKDDEDDEDEADADEGDESDESADADDGPEDADDDGE